VARIPSQRDLQIVAKRLAYLDRAWTEDVEDEEVERCSNVLRLLLIDGWYATAWHAAGNPGEPSVRAVDLEAALGDRNLDEIEYEQAGGGISFGIELSDVAVIGRAPTEEEIRAGFERASKAMFQGFKAFERPYNLSEYLASPSLLAQGRFISRRTIVRYMAHRLGGNHLGRSGHKEEETFDFLDELSSGFVLAGRPAIYFEALSIGQTIGASDDARALRRNLKGGRQ
jgi:hypothetical protein